MTTWAQFESEASDLAAMIRSRFEAAETHKVAGIAEAANSSSAPGTRVSASGPSAGNSTNTQGGLIDEPQTAD
jgi:hypothetical protein